VSETGRTQIDITIPMFQILRACPEDFLFFLQEASRALIDWRREGPDTHRETPGDTREGRRETTGGCEVEI
jgi:hypothetical protein